MKMEVIPAWEIFLGFSDAQKLIKGRMTINTAPRLHTPFPTLESKLLALKVYTPEASLFVSNPELVVDVENFATGEKHMMGTINLWDKISRREKVSASKIYVGEFSQSNTAFEMSCYPFDEKTVFFQIGLQNLARSE